VLPQVSSEDACTISPWSFPSNVIRPDKSPGPIPFSTGGDTTAASASKDTAVSPSIGKATNCDLLEKAPNRRSYLEIRVRL